ncbi:hypothetical protein CYMTET_54145 [Cymbomonas tetramitiformis]|uniref:Uncharacterized protein n=1 Tax=Cymbomonas tetramitiformis TaxID=36881 RepID=A0AAE0BH01_9CHLO|nr:hypothetical protein CYMTET_54145 [Cymbomonas tetramitiformis]
MADTRGATALSDSDDSDETPRAFPSGFQSSSSHGRHGRAPTRKTLIMGTPLTHEGDRGGGSALARTGRLLETRRRRPVPPSSSFPARAMLVPSPEASSSSEAEENSAGECTGASESDRHEAASSCTSLRGGRTAGKVSKTRGECASGAAKPTGRRPRRPPSPPRFDPILRASCVLAALSTPPPSAALADSDGSPGSTPPIAEPFCTNDTDTPSSCSTPTPLQPRSPSRTSPEQPAAPVMVPTSSPAVTLAPTPSHTQVHLRYSADRSWVSVHTESSHATAVNSEVRTVSPEPRPVTPRKLAGHSDFAQGAWPEQCRRPHIQELAASEAPGASPQAAGSPAPLGACDAVVFQHSAASRRGTELHVHVDEGQSSVSLLMDTPRPDNDLKASSSAAAYEREPCKMAASHEEACARLVAVSEAAVEVLMRVPGQEMRAELLQRELREARGALWPACSTCNPRSAPTPCHENDAPQPRNLRELAMATTSIGGAKGKPGKPREEESLLRQYLATRGGAVQIQTNPRSTGLLATPLPQSDGTKQQPAVYGAADCCRAQQLPSSVQRAELLYRSMTMREK